MTSTFANLNQIPLEGDGGYYPVVGARTSPSQFAGSFLNEARVLGLPSGLIRRFTVKLHVPPGTGNTVFVRLRAIQPGFGWAESSIIDELVFGAAETQKVSDVEITISGGAKLAYQIVRTGPTKPYIEISTVFQAEHASDCFFIGNSVGINQHTAVLTPLTADFGSFFVGGIANGGMSQLYGCVLDAPASRIQAEIATQFKQYSVGVGFHGPITALQNRVAFGQITQLLSDPWPDHPQSKASFFLRVSGLNHSAGGNSFNISSFPTTIFPLGRGGLTGGITVRNMLVTVQPKQESDEFAFVELRKNGTTVGTIASLKEGFGVFVGDVTFNEFDVLDCLITAHGSNKLFQVGLDFDGPGNSIVRSIEGSALIFDGSWNRQQEGSAFISDGISSNNQIGRVFIARLLNDGTGFDGPWIVKRF